MSTTNFVVTPSGAGYAESDGLNPVSSTEATCVITGNKLKIVLSDGSSWKTSSLENSTLNGNPLSTDPRVAIEELAAAGFRTPSGGSGGGDTITNNRLTYVGDQLTSIIKTDQSTFTSNSVTIQGGSVDPIDLISSDVPNDIVLGTDNKLLSQVQPGNVFSSGYSTWAAQVQNNINIPDGQNENLINYIPPSSAVSSQFPIQIIQDPAGDYIKLDYLGTDENLTIDLGFAGSQGGTDFLRIEIRRLDGSTVERSRTTFPINDNDSPFGKVVLPTLTVGASDPYYTEGFRIFLINTTGGAFSIPPTINFQDINEDNFFRLYISRNFTKTITV